MDRKHQANQAEQAQPAGGSWSPRSRVGAALLAAAALVGSVAAVPHADVEVESASAVSLSMRVEPGEGTPLAALREKNEGELYNNGHNGQGIDVALIDSGVSPVPGMDTAGQVIYGPDLSIEGDLDNLASLDTYGHGTHMAGIIAGNNGDDFLGMAPEARIVSVKVAGPTVQPMSSRSLLPSTGSSPTSRRTV